jgi:hypothetical protein
MRQDAHEQPKMKEIKGPSKVIHPSLPGAPAMKVKS